MSLVKDRILIASIAELDDDQFARAWESSTPRERLALKAELERLKRIHEDPSPLHLMLRLDPTRVSVDWLEVVDRELVLVRDAIVVMMWRRQRFTALRRSGMPEREASERAATEIPEDGNTRLMVSGPPQEGKSQLCTVYTPLWFLRQFPGLRWGIVSYEEDNASRFSRDIRTLIERFDGSDKDVPDLGLRLMKDEKAKSRWQLVDGGSMTSVSTGGGLTGKPLDGANIDDPVKGLDDADSEYKSEKAWTWYGATFRTRLAPGAPVIEPSTRWSETDLLGRQLARQAEGETGDGEDFDRWVYINVPAKAEYRPELGETDILGREPGEYLASARGRTAASWRTIESETDARTWNALYQGRPSPESGTVWLKEWWGVYLSPVWSRQPTGVLKIATGFSVKQSWDFTFKDTRGTDYVVGMLLARNGADVYVLTIKRARMTFGGSITAMRDLTRLMPGATAKYVEEKANGAAIIDQLRHEIAGIVAVDVGESKVARARACSPFVEAGNVHLPDPRLFQQFPELAFDVDTFVTECSAFPHGANDDQVDALSQYLKKEFIDGGTTVVSAPTDQRLGRAGLAERLDKKPGMRTGSVQERLTAKALGKSTSR